MRCASRRCRPFSLSRAALAAAMLAACLSRPAAAAGDRILVEGLADAELWDTGARSLLLSRNEGDPAAQGRLRIWSAAQLAPGLQGFLLGRAEGGAADAYQTDDDAEVTLEQGWLRYTFGGPLRLVAQAGRMAQPAGNFARRYLSSQNPLIGAPALYDLRYPYAVELTGSAGRVDFLAALTDRPISRQIYLPEPSSSIRPVLGAGVTPLTGLRFGVWATRGAYLAREVEPWLPAGRNWRDYSQQVRGFELQFSRGHFELNGECTRSRFEVPGQPDATGTVYYVEPKYTWSPRWFTALRLERTSQADVWLPWFTNWYLTWQRVWDIETGVGYRIDPRTILKLSYRVERRTEDPGSPPELDHALAAQLSFGFDVRSWFERPR